jgi:hypothetical protein
MDSAMERPVGRRRLLKAAVLGGSAVGLGGGITLAALTRSSKGAQVGLAGAQTTGRGASSSPAVSSPGSAKPSASASGSKSVTARASEHASAQTSSTSGGYLHPGLLHTEADFQRMASKVSAGAQPWTEGWQRLSTNSLAAATWKPNPQAVIYRGSGYPENYATMYYDIHAAYQNALCWKITGQTAHAQAAVAILNAWSGKLTKLAGSTDVDIAAGIYGYQWCNAAEIMRGYPRFDLERFKTMMLEVFYPINDSFLTKHNGAYITNYWASWDQLTMASILAIGILCDDPAKVTQAVNYYKTGKGMGAIRNAVPVRYSNGMAEWLEAGRDQGHATLGIGLTAALCEMAWSQGIDLYGYDDNLFLAGAEYVACYNLGNNVPYTTYTWNYGEPGVWSGSQTFTAASPNSRGDVRPIWEMIYNHYVRRMGLSATYVTQIAASVRPEGGGGQYGPNSGGFDQLGFGTLTFSI